MPELGKTRFWPLPVVTTGNVYGSILGFEVLHTVSLSMFAAVFAIAGNTNNATPSASSLAELQVPVLKQGYISNSICLNP